MAAEEPLKKLDGLELPAAADMHVHLREGDMTELIVYVDFVKLVYSSSDRTADPPSAKAASTLSS